MRALLPSAIAAFFALATPMHSAVSERDLVARWRAARHVEDIPPWPRVMPMPAQVERRLGGLAITESFAATIRGHDDARLRRGIERALARLGKRTALPIATAPVTDGALVIDVAHASPNVPVLEEDESYSLDVGSDHAVLKSASVVGALHGLETLLQITEGGFVPAAHIEDRPRYPWRGLLIDSSRHFEPVPVILRNLDGMAVVKLNVFHWHLTDDQGFRVESTTYPRLTEAGSDGHFYTHEEIEEVIGYAADRGIRVVPEFDVPGHSSSWLVGNPEIGSTESVPAFGTPEAPAYAIERRFGIFDAALDPTRDGVYDFLEGFFAEMAALFPDRFMHIGGDEVTGRAWRNSPRIAAYMREHGMHHPDDLQAAFNVRLAAILKKHGKQVVGWDEILRDEMPKDILIQSWRGAASLTSATSRGYRGILSSGLYLDHMHPADVHYVVDPITAPGMLGGEACMWAESVDPTVIDARIWPRLAAIAERFWSPRDVNDVDAMYRRLDFASAALEEVGLLHEEGPTVLLRRASGTSDVRAMESVLDTLQPYKPWTLDGSFRTVLQTTPLDRVVDIVRADGRASNALMRAVRMFLADPGHTRGRASLQRAFAAWRRGSTDILVNARASSRALEDIQDLAAEVGALGRIGEDAVKAIGTGQRPPPAWFAEAARVIDASRSSRAGVHIAVLPAMVLLTSAVH